MGRDAGSGSQREGIGFGVMGDEIVEKTYWDEAWRMTPLPKGLNPRAGKTRNYVNRRFHEEFQARFSRIDTKGKRLLEIGCARSIWLPYFAKEFGFDVYGVDYSEVGCRQALKMVRNEGGDGKVLCADFFSTSCFKPESFDVVVSFGLVEHFQDTAACIAALSGFLKPGGLMITNIPNMFGAVGFFQKMINRPVYELHVPVDQKRLFQAHVSSGLEILACDYFLFINFGVCNLNGVSRNSLGWVLKKGLLTFLSQFSLAVWFLEEQFGSLRSSRFMAPYINCYARKPTPPVEKANRSAGEGKP